MQNKVEICGVNTSKLKVLKASETDQLLKKAKDGEFNLIRLPDRINKKPLPEIAIADMRREVRRGNNSSFSSVSEAELLLLDGLDELDEFDELDGYEAISLKYYADGVVTDDYDEPIEDVDAIIGSDSLTRFGEYEDDSVFVRNEALKTDYEILADIRKYSDVVKSKPHYAEGV